MSKTREAQSTFCWLIENGKQAGQGLAYRRMEQGLPVWTEDATKALWFVRREDAEAFAEEDREAERIVEHGFHTPLKAEPEQSPIVGSKTWFEDGKMVTQYLTAADVYKEPEQEPVAWGDEGWESLAWELCADEHGEEACSELIWEGGAIPEPWGDRWLKYEGEAKRLIALVKKHTSPQPREWQELSEDETKQAYRAHADKMTTRSGSWDNCKNAFECGIKFASAALRAKNGG